MTIEFKHTELFGGAITASIPSGFADVSTIRQVPDNQEVYLDATGLTSLTIDLTQRVTHLPTDQEALHYHLDDIIPADDSKQILAISTDTTLPKFPPNTPVLSLLARTTPSSVGAPRRPHAPSRTDVHLALIRLVEQSTDVVVTLNVPYVDGGAEEAGGGEGDERAARMKEIWEVVVGSLEVRDWGLFGGA